MPERDHNFWAHIELMNRLKEAKPAMLLERPDSPGMHSLWEGRYTVASGGFLGFWARKLLGSTARRPDYVVRIIRPGRPAVRFRLENSSAEVVGEIRIDHIGVFQGMTYRELAAKAATVMLADLRKRDS
jgi:hypothetical protein